MRSYYQKQKTKYIIVMSLAFILTVLLVFTFWFLQNQYILTLFIWVSLLFAIFGIFLLAHYSINLFFKSWDKYDDFNRGEQGENIVNDELSKLERTVHYRDIVLPGFKWNIDHIVLTRKGVFVLETKNPRGRLGVDGEKWYSTETNKFNSEGKRKLLPKSPTLQARKNAVKLRDYLLTKLPEANEKKLFVNPVVVLVDEFNREDIRTEHKIISVEQIKDEFHSEEFKIDKDLLYSVKKELDLLDGKGKF